jgi:hypothetical protein
MSRQTEKIRNGRPEIFDLTKGMLFGFEGSLGAIPSSGGFSFDDNDYTAITILKIDQFDESGFDKSSITLLIGSGAQIEFTSDDDLSRAIVFETTGAASDQGTHIEIPVFYKSGIDGSDNDNRYGIITGESVGISFWNASGSGTGSPTQMPYTFDVAVTDTDPTAGKLKFDNLVYANVTEIYIDDLNKDGLDQSAIISDTVGGATITVQQSSDPERSAIFDIIDAVVDGVGYWKIQVAHNASGTGGLIEDGKKVEVFINSVGAFNRANATGVTQITGGIITPATLTANVFDYDPTGFADANMIRQDLDANNRCIGGFVAPASGVNRTIKINNISTSGFDLKFFHENGASAAANRLLMRDELDKSIKPNETAEFWYDHISLRWRPLNRIG